MRTIKEKNAEDSKKMLEVINEKMGFSIDLTKDDLRGLLTDIYVDLKIEEEKIEEVKKIVGAKLLKKIKINLNLSILERKFENKVENEVRRNIQKYRFGKNLSDELIELSKGIKRLDKYSKKEQPDVSRFVKIVSDEYEKLNPESNEEDLKEFQDDTGPDCRYIKTFGYIERNNIKNNNLDESKEETFGPKGRVIE